MFTKIARQKIKATRKQMFGKHPDVYTKMYQFVRTDAARALGYYPYYPKIENSDATEVTIDGKQKIMLGSNNYPWFDQSSESDRSRYRSIEKIRIRFDRLTIAQRKYSAS